MKESVLETLQYVSHIYFNNIILHDYIKPYKKMIYKMNNQKMIFLNTSSGL